MNSRLKLIFNKLHQMVLIETHLSTKIWKRPLLARALGVKGRKLMRTPGRPLPCPGGGRRGGSGWLASSSSHYRGADADALDALDAEDQGRRSRLSSPLGTSGWRRRRKFCLFLLGVARVSLL